MADDNSQAGISSIFDITVRGDIAGLQQLLSTKDVNIEARDTAGRTALHLAVTAASVDICKCLINHGARLDTWTDQGEAIVHLAAKRGDVAILHTVMEALGTKQQDIQTDNNPDDKGEAKVDSKKDRTVHVNCLTRKYRMSPLYIAVALGTFYHHLCCSMVANNPNSTCTSSGGLISYIPCRCQRSGWPR